MTNLINYLLVYLRLHRAEALSQPGKTTTVWQCPRSEPLRCFHRSFRYLCLCDRCCPYSRQTAQGSLYLDLRWRLEYGFPGRRCGESIPLHVSICGANIDNTQAFSVTLYGLDCGNTLIDRTTWHYSIINGGCYGNKSNEWCTDKDKLHTRCVNANSDVSCMYLACLACFDVFLVTLMFPRD